MSKKTEIEDEISDEEFERIMSIDPKPKPKSRRSRKSKRLPATDSNGVGYKNPPKSGQFKKGQSGNPKGRPKKGEKESSLIKSIDTILTENLTKPVTIIEDGEKKDVLQLEAIVKKYIVDCAKGTTREKKALFDWIDERVPHLWKKINLGNGDLPHVIRIEFVQAKEGKPVYVKNSQKECYTQEPDGTKIFKEMPDRPEDEYPNSGWEWETDEEAEERLKQEVDGEETEEKHKQEVESEETGERNGQKVESEEPAETIRTSASPVELHGKSISRDH